MTKKLLGLSLVVLFGFTAGICLAKYSGGDGSEATPYRISDANDMNAIGLHEEDWSSHFVMVNDVNLAQFTGTQFNIIGNSTTKFTGVFDGNGFTISNFTYNSTGKNCIGIFGYVYGVSAEIKNLGLIDPNVNAGTGRRVGSLVGRLYSGIINNCYIEGGQITANGDGVGLVVGYNDGDDSLISNCHARGNVTGYKEVGGAIGISWRGKVEYSSFQGSVTAINDYVGGFIGRQRGNPTVYGCYAKADVSGRRCVGGFMGGNGGNYIVNCYAEGSAASHSGYWDVGGLVGDNDSLISKCYCTTELGSSGGSLVGYNDGTVLDCFSGTDVTMNRETYTYAGWDFVGETLNGTEDLWKIKEDVDSPRFWWEVGDHNELSYIEIIGPNQVQYFSSTKFYAKAHYVDGDNEYITKLSSWIVEPSTFATINQHGLLILHSIPEDDTITIKAEYAEEGITRLTERVISISASSETIYVDESASGREDGSSWQDAFVFLQDAIAVADPCDVILIAQGQYRPNYSKEYPYGIPNRALSFNLKQGVTIRGGYAGLTLINPDERDVRTFETILNGDLVVTNENCYHVVTCSDVGGTAVLDGLIITGGNADGPLSLKQRHGSGIFLESASPRITNCLFEDNMGANGSAIYACSNSSPFIENCIIANNVASSYGGGIYNVGESSPHLVNCQITGNSANKGSAAYNSKSKPVYRDCDFKNNSGQIIYNYARNTSELYPTFIDCNFINNTGNIYNTNCNSVFMSCLFNGNTSAKGGAMQNYYSSPTIINCSFANNEATSTSGGYGGGAIYNRESCNPVITECIFNNNTTLNCGGAIYNTENEPTIKACIFVGNKGNKGGVIYNYRASATIEKCIFTDNYATDHGGAIYSLYSTTNLSNCVLNNNTSEKTGGAIYSNFLYGDRELIISNCTFADNDAISGTAVSCETDDDRTADCYVLNSILRDGGNEVFFDNETLTTVGFSCVQGGWPGISNIDLDPCFVDANNADLDLRDYHLLENSPCINAGDPCYIAEPDETDLDGNPRIIGGRIDMGAYEAFLDPLDLLLELTEDISNLGLHQGIENSLLAKLNTALQKLEDDNENNDAAAINLLEAFINTVEAQRGKKIPEADANAFIAAAQEIIDLLTNQ